MRSAACRLPAGAGVGTVAEMVVEGGCRICSCGLAVPLLPHTHCSLYTLTLQPKLDVIRVPPSLRALPHTLGRASTTNSTAKSRSTSLYNAGASSRGGCRALQLYSAPERSTALQLYSALHSTSSTPSLRPSAVGQAVLYKARGAGCFATLLVSPVAPVTKNGRTPSAKREDAISNSEVHLGGASEQNWARSGVKKL